MTSARQPSCRSSATSTAFRPPATSRPTTAPRRSKCPQVTSSGTGSIRAASGSSTRHPPLRPLQHSRNRVLTQRGVDSAGPRPSLLQRYITGSSQRCAFRAASASACCCPLEQPCWPTPSCSCRYEPWLTVEVPPARESPGGTSWKGRRLGGQTGCWIVTKNETSASATGSGARVGAKWPTPGSSRTWGSATWSATYRSASV